MCVCCVCVCDIAALPSRLRAARIDDFVATIRQLHKEFQWPLPTSDEQPAPGYHTHTHTLHTHTDTHTHTHTHNVLYYLAFLTDLKTTPTAPPTDDSPSHTLEETLSPASSSDSRTKQTFSPDSDTGSVSSLKRPHRPPDLDLRSLNLTPVSHQDITIHTQPVVPPVELGESGAEAVPAEKMEDATRPTSRAVDEKRRETSVLSSVAAHSDFDPTRSSTPTTAKMSGSVSERISLIPVSLKHCELLTHITSSYIPYDW